MNYHLLGRTGLRVSPLALGTMTFGNDWGWGSSEDTARKIFNAYIDVGGNFVDTADLYTNGTSESLVGKYIKERSLRDKVVLATKYTFNGQPGNPNAGGNGRKNLYRAIDSSLKRLGTDYIDLFWVHAWDTLTPVEEVIQSLNTLVESGKVRYVGLSDCPAWYVSRAQTLAELRGWERVAALQLEYNLTERSIENEFVPMVQELGMGICVWSPLANGFLSGKYEKGRLGEGRLKATQGSGNPALERVISREKNWEIAEELKHVARQIDRSPAQIALNWVAKRPGVSSTLIGATKIDQLETNLRSLDFDLPLELRQRLDRVSAPDLATPYMFFEGTIHGMTTGGTKITREPDWFRG